MKKDILKKILSKYYLGGRIEENTIIVDKDGLVIPFHTDDVQMGGVIRYPDIIFSQNLPIYNTGFFLKNLTLLSEDIDVEYKSNYINVTDDKFLIQIQLADAEAISSYEKMLSYKEEEYFLDFDIDYVFIKDFLSTCDIYKSTKDNNFSIKRIREGLLFSFGDYSKISFNKKLSIKSVDNFDNYYKTDIFADILKVNKEFDNASFHMSKNTIKLNFNSDSINSTYYIVKQDV